MPAGPSSALAYYQQAGRAGRHGPGIAVLLPNDNDEKRWKFFRDLEQPDETLAANLLAGLAPQDWDTPCAFWRFVGPIPVRMFLSPVIPELRKRRTCEGSRIPRSCRSPCPRSPLPRAAPFDQAPSGPLETSIHWETW